MLNFSYFKNLKIIIKLTFAIERERERENKLKMNK